MEAHEHTAITTAGHPPKVWEWFVDDIYFILKRTYLENFFHHIKNFHQNIKFTIEEESKRELAFFWHFIEIKQWRDLCVGIQVA